MRIIDIHKHFWRDSSWWSPATSWQFAYQASRSKFPYEDPQAILPHVGELRRDLDGSQMISEMDDAGIDVGVILPFDFGMVLGDPPTPWEDINKFCCDLAKTYPGRVLSFFGIDVRRPGMLKFFEKSVNEWGARGLKLFPPGGFYPNDPVCYPYYQKALDLDVPVLIHAGVQRWPALGMKYSDPIHLDDVGRAFPELTVIIAHAGMDSRASNAWWETAVNVAMSKPNFYVDLAEWQYSFVDATADMPELFRKLKIMRDMLGAHRILFATDMPTSLGRKAQERVCKWVELFKNLPEVAKQYGVNFSMEETELMVHGNAERILKMG